MKQTQRDLVAGDLSLEYFARWMSAGWKVASVEWVREAGNEDRQAGEVVASTSAPNFAPYGLRVAGGGTLEEHPLEATVLLRILDQIVREKGMQEIAAELNAMGYVTREGQKWSAIQVFNLLPRLIDAGPELLKSLAWRNRAASPSDSEIVQ